MAADSSTEMSLDEDGRLGRNQIAQRIFSSHYEALLGFLRGRLGQFDEASDLAQETCLRLYRQPNLDKLQGKERSYLFKVATNLLKDRHRRRVTRDNAQHFVLETILRPGAVEQETPQRVLEYKQTLKVIKRTLLSMDSKPRRIFLMRRLRRLTYREIAADLQVSERTVERQMHKALRLLKKALMAQAAGAVNGSGASV